MPEKINFTKASISQLPVPREARATYRDAKCRGLCIRITPTGARTFYFNRKVKGRNTWIALGPFPDLTVEQARRKVDELNGAVATGEDLEPKAKDPTFDQIFAWYIENHAKPRKITWEEDQEKYDRHLKKAFGTRRAADITMDQVSAFHAHLGAERGIYSANRNLALLRTVLNKAIKFELVPGPNPAMAVEMFREQQRDRRLMPSEIQTFLQAVMEEPSEDIRDFVLLCLFTGARRSNVLTMRWEDIRLDDATWRIPRTKTGDSQNVPLEAPELAILGQRQTHAESPWVFPSKRSASGHMVEPQIGWRRILDRAGLKNLRLHDLRRTLGSWMVDTGASLPMIGKVLNHKSQQTTAIYARLSVDPVREAKGRALAALLASSKSQGDERLAGPISGSDEGN